MPRLPRRHRSCRNQHQPPVRQPPPPPPPQQPPVSQPQPPPQQQDAVPRAEPLRLRQVPDLDHVPEDYSDVVDANDVVTPAVYQAMERHLPPALLGADRGVKLVFMRGILNRYIPSPEELIRKEKHREYRQRIASSYEPLHSQLYRMNPSAFFLPSFLRAIRGNTIESFRHIIQEAAPNVFSFSMLRPAFCEMLMAEVQSFQNWARTTKQKIMLPNTMDKPGSGVAISDIGMQGMLEDLMKQFISPISKVLFREVGGGSLDSQHSFVISYGGDDSGLGMRVDDCDVTLNVCLGRQFTGGDLCFCGIRCVSHVNSEIHEEEKYLCSHIPGQALLYHGRHRHFVLPTSSGLRVNMTMWCRSSAFKEMMKCKTDFPDWCGKCLSEKKARQAQYVNAMRMSLLNIQQ